MKTRLKRINLLVAIFFFGFFVTASVATPVYWANNDHYYELVQSPSDWNSAKIAAENMFLAGGYIGHLVTITSAEENLWITATFGNALVNPFAWTGAYQSDPLLPSDQGWGWVTGESWTFSNWGVNEPNDYWETAGVYPGQYETVFHFWGEINSNGMAWADTLPSFGMYSLVEFEKPASTVPEPTTVLLFGAGIAGLAAVGRRRK